MIITVCQYYPLKNIHQNLTIFDSTRSNRFGDCFLHHSASLERCSFLVLPASVENTDQQFVDYGLVGCIGFGILIFDLRPAKCPRLICAMDTTGLKN
jgi:hypothetical protein